MRKILAAMAVLTALSACGGDDGAAVRESGAASGSASASGGSGSAAASGSGTASGATADKCEVVDGTEEAATAEIHAELTEYKIALDKTTVPAGKIKFEGENAGEEPHEIAIVRAADAAQLPKASDGSADEGDALVGEIEPFAAGKSCDGTFELAAGAYAVICNIVEEEANGDIEAHFAEGMYTNLTVS